MRLLCTKLLIQQRWDVHPIVSFYCLTAPAQEVFFTLSLGYIADPAQLEIRDMSLNSLLFKFSAIYVRLGRSSDILQYKLLRQG